ncbi:MAG TPA: hypothetical protein VGF69_07710 [Thermoanaerobaculia bacterium]|jgi:hypothetical protein
MTTTPVTSAPPPRASKKSWLIGLPIALIAVAALAWLLLAGLPFGGDEPRSTPQPQVETVTEGTATATAGNTTMLDGRIEELTGTDTTSINTTTTSAAPPTTAPPSAAPPVTQYPDDTATQAPPPSATPRPAPSVTSTPRPAPPRPTPATQTPPPTTMPPSRPDPATEPAQSSSRSGEISVSDAMSTLRSYVTSSNYYRIDSDCIAVNNLGYRNVGYTLEVRDRCEDRGLGRWRVDSKTREVFRQQGDGRFVRP